MTFTGDKARVNKTQVCIRILLKLEEHFSLNVAIVLGLEEGKYFIPIC